MAKNEISSAEFAEANKLSKVEEQVQTLLERKAQLENRVHILESSVRKVTKERDDYANRLDVVDRLEQGELKPPKWAAPKAVKSNNNHATPVLMLSDLHLDEIVKPEQVDWYNAYNREIAEKRLARTIERTILLTKEFFSGLKYDGFTLLLGGDIFSGIIHQELRESNEAPMMASLHYWEPIMAGAVERLASVYGNMDIYCTYGNHGRNSFKPIAKNRALDSFEWLFYHNVARSFKNSKTVKWHIPEAADVMFQIYSLRNLLTHGDQFRGGSGIAGALSPLMLGTMRKTRRQAAMGKPYDLMWIGHWHQLMTLPSKGLIVNGALKGMDEFAFLSNFEPELAQQALMLVTPEHGVSFSAPIISQHRESEGW